MEKNLFEVATRRKYRFPYRGLVAVEDLWDLRTAELDAIFKTLNAETKKVSEESLLELKTKEDEELSDKIAIVRHIVSVKLEEQKIRGREKANKEMKQKLFPMRNWMR